VKEGTPPPRQACLGGGVKSQGEERWLGHPSDSREYKDKGATVNREIDLAGHTCQEDQLNKENKGETHA